jgi:hypothetical protein
MTTTTTTYECRRDADGWQMYSYEGYEHLRRAKRRGVSLSKRLTKLVNAAKAKLAVNPDLSERKLAVGVRDAMHKLMDKYADDGAQDTEPQCVLVAELECAFGLDQYSLDRW